MSPSKAGRTNARNTSGKRTRGVRVRTIVKLGLVLEGELYQRMGALQAQLLGDGGALVLDGAVVEPKRLGDLLAGLRFGNQAKDVALPLAQHCER